MASEQKVHVYTASREDRLLQLVFFLWSQLPPEQQEELAPDIEAGEMGWAIPTWERRNQDDWLTVEQLTADLGISASGLWNWRSRYGLTSKDGKYRWGDVQGVIQQRKRRRMAR